MQENKYKNTALIDADYILWIACNPNKVEGKDKKPLKEGGKFVYTPKTVEQAINTCDAYIGDILNITHSDSYILCLTGRKNFRVGMDSSYKANRVGMDKPLWFSEVREHMKENWDAIEVEGLEADDLVNICKNTLPNSFIVAVDKDILDCIPGRHFDARRGRVCFTTTSEDLANFNFAKSLLTGDLIDGVGNMMKGYGPKTAEKDLKRLENFIEGADPLTIALSIYIGSLGPEEGKKKFEHQYHLLKIIGSKEELPEGIVFDIPEPSCWDCVETQLSDDKYTLEYAE